ncbi:MAG: SusD/RagB family nutrient-binding outer membrane lipoprotein [Gemmatimonadetes bacterium]|nr:SusD/RagB family nutrient-binding outer membrane lipoprotein [Gemmatimonadota bacterium]
MKRITKAGIALSLAVLTAGCGDFLQGPGLTENPNSATEASTTAQFVAIQANMMTLMEGQLARFAGMYTQQIIGSNNQQQLQGTQYGVVEGDVSGFMSAFYTGAGLVGLRKVQAAAKAAGDAQYEGIAKIWEAFAMGTAASIWGDLPYREANDPVILTPKLDTQQAIYTAVIALLDNGITLLGGVGPGPGATDLIYGGNPGRWIRAAYTLKARFLLHLVERDGVARYTQAITAANLGINEAATTPAAAMNGQAAGDFRALHGSTLNVDANIWAQFLGSRQDIVAGDPLVSILKARTDPRLSAYFDVSCVGTPPTTVCGMDRNGISVGGTPSVVNTVTRRSNTFRQPFITWAETQLILAEARFQTGDAPGALINMNNVRTIVGLPALGAATLQGIMLEKYIAMFQNVDVWSDYKRTCIPAITPYSTRVEVLGRLPYGSAERTNNPNIPLPASFPTGTSGAASVRNWNDPNRCP